MAEERLFGSAESVLDGVRDDLNSFRGLPYRGKAEIIDKDNQPVKKRETHIAQFALNSEEDMAKYSEIIQKVADGASQISFEERVYDDTIKSWRVLIRWFDLVYEAPKKKKVY